MKTNTYQLAEKHRKRLGDQQGKLFCAKCKKEIQNGELITIHYSNSRKTPNRIFHTECYESLFVDI